MGVAGMITEHSPPPKKQSDEEGTLPIASAGFWLPRNTPSL